MSTDKYNDIIMLSHHISATRPKMPLRDRAAQFAPFAALSGYDDMVEETARITEIEDEASEYDILLLDSKLRMLKEHESDHPRLELTYFCPDERKSGGRHETVRAKLKRIDELEQILILDNGKRIPFDKITAVSSLVLTGG